MIREKSSTLDRAPLWAIMVFDTVAPSSLGISVEVSHR
jgi:hypothetical protein